MKWSYALMRWNWTVHRASSSRSTQSLSEAFRSVSQQRAWVTLILTNHIIPPPFTATLMKRRTNQRSRGRSPVGILRVSARNSVWGRGESEDKHPNKSHRLDFFSFRCARRITHKTPGQKPWIFFRTEDWEGNDPIAFELDSFSLMG